MFQCSGKQIKSQSPDSGVAGLRELKKNLFLTVAPPTSKLSILHSWEYDFSFVTFMIQMEPFALTSVYKGKTHQKEEISFIINRPHSHDKKKTCLHSSHLLPQNFDFHFKRFPHRLFIFHSSPTLNGTIMSFIWNHKTLRIKKKQINPPRGEKGDGSCQLLNCRIGLASKHGFLFQQLSQWGEMNGYDRES